MAVGHWRSSVLCTKGENQLYLALPPHVGICGGDTEFPGYCRQSTIIWLHTCSWATHIYTVPVPLLSTMRAGSGLFTVEMRPESLDGNNEGSRVGKLSVLAKNEARRKNPLLKNVKAQNGLLFGVCLGVAMWPLQSSANKGQSGIRAEVTSASLLVEVWLPSKLPVNDGLDAWSSSSDDCYAEETTTAESRFRPGIWHVQHLVGFP